LLSSQIFTAILALYLNRKLDFDPSTSTAFFHLNELLAYSFTIVGAIVADSWLGMLRTLLWTSLVYSVGSLIIAVGAIEPLNLPTL
jgi:dipeptide/tripeptide permease